MRLKKGCWVTREQVRMNQMNNKLPEERVDVWVARCDGSRHRYYGLNGVRNLLSPGEVAATIEVRFCSSLHAYMPLLCCFAASQDQSMALARSRGMGKSPVDLHTMQ